MRRLPNVLAAALFAAPLLTLAACGRAKEDQAISAEASGLVLTATTTVECKDLPSHVALVGDAAVSHCLGAQTRPGHRAGSVIFTSAMPPEAVIAFYQQKAQAAGMHEGKAVPEAWSATDGAKRTILVMPAVKEGKTHVVINWGLDE